MPVALKAVNNPLRSDGQVWCKICGIKESVHAALCSELGVDAIGFVFVEQSPRFIGLAQAETVAASTQTDRVGLFVDPDPVMVREAISAARLTMLQFNGDEPAEFCEQFGLPYLRAVQMRPGADVAIIAERFDTAHALLLDTYAANARGGTGKKFDWGLWPQEIDMPLIVAGGLTSKNVRRAVMQLNPSGVDVSGGVEARKGQKDSTLIEKFIQEVRNVG